MKTFDYFYENMIPSGSLLSLCDSDDILFFDIETTGLSRLKNHIYLIGCGYYSDNGLHIIQWFAENENEEHMVLNEFIEFSSSFSTVVNYNGKTFDIPFTTERLNKYNLVMPDFISVDLYAYVKPLKKFLSLTDSTQKSVEAFLSIKREDKYNGGELIPVYKKYTYSHNAECLNLLLLHNKEDVLNMHYLSAITAYLNLLSCEYSYLSHEIKEFTDYNGNNKQELILSASVSSDSNINCLKSFSSFYNDGVGSFIMNFRNDGSICVRIPVIRETLKCFMDNYKDYYYLPKEDICVYKEVASSVSKENREKARKDNCFIRCSDIFIPVKDTTSLSCPVHCFKSDYKSKQSYIRLSDFTNADDEFKSSFVKSLILSFK